MRKLALVLALVFGAATADARYRREGFAFPRDRRVTVAIICPQLFIGSINGRGEKIVNEAWTRTGYANLQAEIAASDVARVVSFSFSDCDPSQPPTPLAEEFNRTLNLRQGDLANRVPPGTFPLPNDDLRALRGIPRGRYVYSVGPELAAQLRALHPGADYALYFQVYDTFSTSGRIVGRIFGAFLGNPVVSPPHYANTFLIDLADGGIVWIHNDGAVLGDLRQRASSRRRLDDLWRRFPGFELLPGGGR